MNQYSCLAATIGALMIVLMTASTASASTIPVIFCPPNPNAETPARVRQLCLALMDELETAPKEGEYIDTSALLDRHMDGRGLKRQDVDHVFLRFGRRNGL